MTTKAGYEKYNNLSRAMGVEALSRPIRLMVPQA